MLSHTSISLSLAPPPSLPPSLPPSHPNTRKQPRRQCLQPHRTSFRGLFQQKKSLRVGWVVYLGGREIVRAQQQKLIEFFCDGWGWFVVTGGVG